MQHLVPDYDPHPRLQEEMNDCLKLNGAGKPLSTAEDRGDNKAHYACGALLLLAAEAASRKNDRSADALTFVRRLIDANRSDGEITEAKWLASFSQVAGPAARDEVQEFIDRGVADPLAFWADLFTATGVGFTRQRDTLTLLDASSAI
jgi:predicted metalloprotease with PDZ domain